MREATRSCSTLFLHPLSVLIVAFVLQAPLILADGV